MFLINNLLAIILHVSTSENFSIYDSQKIIQVPIYR